MKSFLTTMCVLIIYIIGGKNNEVPYNNFSYYFF